MQKSVILDYIFLISLNGCKQNRYRTDLPRVNADTLRFAPAYYSTEPNLVFPAMSEQYRELVLVEISDGRYSWFDATVETC